MMRPEDTLVDIAKLIFERHATQDVRVSNSKNSMPLDEVVAALRLYAPNSAGTVLQRSSLTLACAQQIFPFLLEVIISLGYTLPPVLPIGAVCNGEGDASAAHQLKTLLDATGSDKAASHDYHLLYGKILQDGLEIRSIFEVGLGTNNESLVSNMGATGKPGASLRAFRDYCPQALVFGGDVDREILFSEERIQTFFVDQTDRNSFTEIDKIIPDDLDLFIDDGLHAPHANIVALGFGLRKIRLGGWVVIEDIVDDALPFWRAVGAILPETYRPAIYLARGGILFAAQRIK